MADELRVVITADASGVGPGVAEATAAVQASAEQIAVAQGKATAATLTLAEAQKAAKQAASSLADAELQLGASAAAGNQAAIAIINEYSEANAKAAAVLEAVAAAEKQATAATYNRMEAMGSARVMMGAMDGSMGMMANGLARLAAGSQVLGPLMQSMIPLAILSAGVFILYDLGEAIYKAFDLGGDAALAYQKALDSVDESTRTLIDSTALEADKLEAANLKLEHLPNPNAAKEAIDQALVDADKMATKLDEIIGKEENLLKMQGAAGSGLQRFFTNEQAPRQEGVDLAEHARYLEQANTLEQQLGESKSFETTEQQRLNELEEKQAALDYARNSSITARIGMWAIGVTQYGKEISSLEQIIAQEKNVTQSIEDQIRVRDAQAKHDTLTGAGKTPKEAKGPADNLPAQIARAQVEAAHATDAELNPAQQITAELQKQLALDLQKEETSKEGTAAERERLRQLEDETAIGKSNAQLHALEGEIVDRDFQQRQKAQEDAQRRQEEQARSAREQANQVRDEQISAARDTAAATIQAANLDYQTAEQDIRSQEELGIISHHVAEQRLEDALRLREQTIQGALAKEQGLFDPALSQKQAIEYDKLQQQMTNEAKRAANERERIAQQETLKIEQMYKRVATAFNTDFERAFNEWATKSQTAGQAFGRMLGTMELQVIDFVAKWLLQKAEMWAMDKLMQTTGIATQVATQKAGDVAMVASDAGVAAAGAMAYYSATNPLMAPALAAVQYAETMSYAVMDTGGMMPHMGFAFNASGSPERVLSPSQTSNFESMVNNGGSRNATLHQTNNFAGGVTKEMLDAHAAQTMNKLRGMLRPEAFA